MRRVVITPEAFNSLLYSSGVCVFIGLFFFAVAIATGIAVVDLVRADFELDNGHRHVGFVGRKLHDVFFPPKGCVSDTTEHAYAVLLLALWVPSCILASLVWPAWLVSLLLGTVLANDNVEDLMNDLTPANVKKFISPLATNA